VPAKVAHQATRSSHQARPSTRRVSGQAGVGSRATARKPAPPSSTSRPVETTSRSTAMRAFTSLPLSEASSATAGGACVTGTTEDARLQAPKSRRGQGVGHGLRPDIDAALGAGAQLAAEHPVSLAGLLAGALSMAAGEYISVRSQRELLAAAASDLDPATLAALEDREAGELALVFRARGLSPAQAEQRAAALFNQPDDQSPAEAEAGEDVVGSAGAAAGSSFVAFASGAVIPLLPFFATTGPTAITTSAVLVGTALFATGATVGVGVLTGGPLVRRGLRQLAIGTAAALVTYALGRVFGATLG
jgi:VIT1/CCC1 family predicted Fe2+/Mn2+ transporter